MDPDAIEVVLFARNVASPLFALVDLRALDAIIVADRNRKAIDHIRGSLVQLLPSFTQAKEQGQEQLGDPMQTAVEAAFAELVRNVATVIQKRLAMQKLPLKYNTATRAVVITSASLICRWISS